MKYLIIGFGKTGISLKKYMDKHNLDYLIIDDKTHNILNEIKSKKLLFDLGIKSPGYRNEEALNTLRICCKNIISEIDFSYLHSASRNIYAITGSNGKTSLTTYLNEFVKIRFRSFAVGNIGTPFVEKLDSIRKGDFVFIEMSSYMLEDSSFIRFKKSFITSISPNHLNAYSDLANYYLSKKRITFLSDNIICLEDNEIFKKNYQEGVKINFPLLFGELNLYYARVAYNFAKDLNINETKLKKKALELKNLNYRLNYRGKIRNFYIINDSKSTSSNSSKYAYNQIKNKKKILILGGIHKSNPFDIEISKGDRVYIYGKDRYLIQKEIKGEVFETLKEIILDIKKIKEEVYLIFSPGCASLDQFESFEKRGEYFDYLINQYLKDE